jgi:hypothetical protein
LVGCQDMSADGTDDTDLRAFQSVRGDAQIVAFRPQRPVNLGVRGDAQIGLLWLFWRVGQGVQIGFSGEFFCERPARLPLGAADCRQGPGGG